MSGAGALDAGGPGLQVTGWEAARSRAELAGLLTAAFLDGPNFRHLFPRERARRRALPHVFAALTSDAAAYGHVDVVDLDGAILGTAVWFPPEAHPMTGQRRRRLLPHLARTAMTSPRSTRRLATFGAAIDEARPTLPHRYLAAIAVSPVMQGSSIGSLLLEAGIDEADSLEQPCYLEAQDPRTVRWYERYGFEVQGDPAPLVPGGPVNWRMVRQPASAAHRAPPADELR